MIRSPLWQCIEQPEMRTMCSNAALRKQRRLQLKQDGVNLQYKNASPFETPIDVFVFLNENKDNAVEQQKDAAFPDPLVELQKCKAKTKHPT